MPAITGTGVGSGLDVNNIVTSLLTLEKRPLQQLEAQASGLQTKLSAFGTLKGQLSSLADIAGKLSDAANWNPIRVDSGDSASVSATGSNTAVAGKHTLQVTQLAQGQSLASGTFSAATAVVGTGTLKLEIGTTSGSTFTPKAGSSPVSIVIDDGKKTLAGVRDAINAAKAGVTASIVTSGGASRLVLKSADGAESSIRLVADNDADGNDTDASGLSALAWDPAAAPGTGRNLTQTQAAQDAQFTLNGLALTSATNTVTQVLEGVTLQLKKPTTTPVDLNVSVEAMAVRKNVNDFVNAYNALNKLLQQQTQADPSGKSRGALTADSAAVGLLGSLRQTLQGAVSGLSGVNSLSTAGVELQRDGSLQVKDAKLTALLENPAQLAKLFGQAQTGGDPNTRGFGVRFKQWADGLTGETGTLASRIDGLNASVKRNTTAQERQQERLARTEAKLRAQYQRLDSNMSSLNAEMARLKSSLGLG